MAEAGLSQRRACRLIPMWRGTLRYARKPGPRSEENERLRQRLRELAGERKRWGYPTPATKICRRGPRIGACMCCWNGKAGS
jgi:putative transposase